MNPPSNGSVLSIVETEEPGIVVFSHLRWNFVWQRPQQFLSRFATSHRILFIEEPIFDLNSGDEGRLELEAVASNIVVAVVHLPEEARNTEFLGETLRKFTREAVNSVNLKHEFDAPLLWYYSPMEASWSLDYFENSGIIYDCMDELSQFKGAPPQLIEQEKRLINRADIIFTGGHELWLKKSKQHPNVHFFGCGVEVDHFGKASLEETSIPEDMSNLAKPVIGWFGVVDERVDYRLLAEMAEKRPDWSFVMVGPVVKVDPADLPQAHNLHWLGGRDYKELPNYCKAFDVCMMAFALNEATEFINPTKALEYLATGKPVISTPVADVVKQYQDTVYIEKDSDGFITRIEHILSQPDAQWRARGIAKAEQCSWDTTVSKMQALIKEATERKGESTRTARAVATI